MNQHHLQFICTEMDIGSPGGSVKRVFGSRAGSMLWKFNTSKGSYVIKQLAPIIDLTSESILKKYELSEKIAYRFSQKGIKAVCALDKSGKHLIIIENIGYLVYPWVEACNLGIDTISEAHAIKIAEVIANLHVINLNVPEIAPSKFYIHTNSEIAEAIERVFSLKFPFSKALQENQSFILSANDSYQAIIPVLKEDTVVTHGDLDQLNVLWDKEKPILIDWETVRELNRTRDIVRSSLSWSGIGTENFSLPIYVNMISTFIKCGGRLNANHVDAALNTIFGSRIHWILYNINLVCTTDVSEERDTGINEINRSLMEMIRAKKLMPDLFKISVSLI